MTMQNGPTAVQAVADRIVAEAKLDEAADTYNQIAAQFNTADADLERLRERHRAAFANGERGRALELARAVENGVLVVRALGLRLEGAKQGVADAENVLRDVERRERIPALEHASSEATAELVEAYRDALAYLTQHCPGARPRLERIEEAHRTADAAFSDLRNAQGRRIGSYDYPSRSVPPGHPLLFDVLRAMAGFDPGAAR